MIKMGRPQIPATLRKVNVTCTIAQNLLVQLQEKSIRPSDALARGAQMAVKGESIEMIQLTLRNKVQELDHKLRRVIEANETMKNQQEIFKKALKKVNIDPINLVFEGK